MTFLYPSFLWALLALMIPIIVHLFNFRKAKKIYFSNVKFLENVKESSSSKLKIKYLLVLLSRLLFITFLVLAFAQPFLPGNEKGLENDSVVIYLDNSQSTTNYTSANTTGLSAGVDYLNQILELYTTDTKFRILTNDFAPSSINYKSKSRAQELATELDYSNLSRSFLDVFRRFETSESPNDIYIISDFQESVFGNTSEKFIDSINNYKIIPINYATNQNVYVDSVFLESPFLIANNTNRLHVKLRSIGKETVNGLLVKLFINDNQTASTSIDIEAESTIEMIFDLNYGLEDINRCKISFEDFPITFDNEYFFTLNLLKRIKIAEISGVSSPYFSSLFSENDLFNYNHFEEGAINFNEAANADLVIFNQLTNTKNSIVGLMADLLNTGRSVFVIPAESQIPSELHKLVGIPIEESGFNEKIGLDIPDIRSPFFSEILESLDQKTLLPQARPIISWRPTSMDILKLKNGQPFLSYIQSSGSIFLLSSPLKDEFTDFQKHALFVPIMYRIAALSSDNYYPLEYNISNQLITLNRDSAVSNELYKLSNGEHELIPQQQTSSDKLTLDIPKYLINPGYYNLTLSGEIKNVLAFNYTTNESLTSPLNQYELEASFSELKNVEILYDQQVETFTQRMKDRFEGRHLWKYALILSLIFLLAEVLLLRFL